MNPTPKPSQEDKDKAAQDAAKPQTKRDGEPDLKATRGERPGNQEWDSGGGDISRGG